MHFKADDVPNLDQIAELLKAREIKNVTISSPGVTVTVSPQLELLSLELTGPAVDPKHRSALQHEIVEAINKAMQEVVISSARMLEGLQEAPEIQSMREALQKEIGRWESESSTA